MAMCVRDWKANERPKDNAHENREANVAAANAF